MAVIDEVCAAVFNTGEGGADGGGKDQVAGLEGGEAAFWTEGVECNYTWIQHEGELESAHGLYEAHDVGSAIRRFVARCEQKREGSGK